MSTPPPLLVRRAQAVALLAALTFCASTATAHLMRAGHGTINVVDQKAYIVISLPVRALGRSSVAAIVGDGVLTAAELHTHRPAIRAAIREGFSLGVADRSASFTTVMINLPVGMGHTAGEDDELTVMIVAGFEGEPRTLWFESTLWADSGDALLIQTSVTADGRMIRSEIGEVTPASTRYVFFATVGRILAASMQRGVSHLFGGADHLAFVLVLLMGSASRRRWAASVAVFATGCCAGMGLSASGWISPSPAWVEVAIAASVVLFAGLRLRGRYGRRPRVEAVLCAAFAVVHGFGFIAAGGFEHAPVPKVTGFGLGLWAGVVAFAGILYAATITARRLFDQRHLQHAARGLAIVGLVVGVVWVADRIPTSTAGSDSIHRISSHVDHPPG